MLIIMLLVVLVLILEKREFAKFVLFLVMEPVSVKMGSIKVLYLEKKIGGGFRPIRGQNFRGFAWNNQNCFRRGPGFTPGFTNYGPRFGPNYPKPNSPFYDYMS